MARWRDGAILALLLCAASVLTARQAPLPSGLDLSGFDRSVRPQDDLFRFVNGRWLATAEIPPDRTTVGTFTELADQSERDLRAVIEGVLETPQRRKGSPQQQIADLYTSQMDEARLNSLGAAPLAQELAKIEAIASPRDLAAECGALTSALAGGPFAITVVVDSHDGGLIAQIAQGGILLPSRDHYLSADAAFVDVRAKYVDYLTRVFTLAGRRDASADAHAVLAFETTLAALQLPPVESRIESRVAPNTTLADIVKTMPGFDWMAWARPQGIDRAARVALLQPAFFRGFAEAVAATPMGTLRAWLAARYLTSMAPYVSQPFVDARFEFFGTVLTGQTLPRARWKVGVSLVSGFLADAVGRLYVEQHFPPRAKARVERLVANVIAAYRNAIGETTWLSNATRAEAQAKLSKLVPRVGYPDRWRTYAGLSIAPDDLVGNVQRARRFDSDYRLSQVAGPGSSGEWLVSAQTVNAFYNPGLNAIYLPAAMLQPPHFNVDADDAVNYGALGATVGHELSHAFDDRGRGYDANGNVRRWWTTEEIREFARRADAIVRQFAAYRPMPGLAVDGNLTLSENLADLMGLAVAHRAYVNSLGGRPAPVLDGFTGDQRFFISYARMWRVKVRDDYLRQWLLTLPYAPYEWRANGPVSQLDAFADVFKAGPGDALFRPPQNRARIWQTP